MINEQDPDLVYRLRKRAEIRRQIPGRKSVEEGKPDRIADILEEAANEIEQLRDERNRLHMRDRILELAKEAGLITYDSDDKMLQVEQFAKLLVDEVESYIEESEGDIDFVRFLIDRRLKVKEKNLKCGAI